jgi:hypothetical protein
LEGPDVAGVESEILEGLVIEDVDLGRVEWVLNQGIELDVTQFIGSFSMTLLCHIVIGLVSNPENSDSRGGFLRMLSSERKFCYPVPY